MKIVIENTSFYNMYEALEYIGLYTNFSVYEIEAVVAVFEEYYKEYDDLEHCGHYLLFYIGEPLSESWFAIHIAFLGVTRTMMIRDCIGSHDKFEKFFRG